MWEYVARKWKDGKNMFNPLVISNSLGKSLEGYIPHYVIHLYKVYIPIIQNMKFFIKSNKACHTWWKCEIKSSFHFCRGRNMQPLAQEVLLKDEHWLSRRLGYVNIAKGNEEDSNFF